MAHFYFARNIKYIMFGLWTQSWLPVAGLLNDYSQITLHNALLELGQAASGIAANATAAINNTAALSTMPPPTNPITLQTLPMIIEQTMQALSNANMLMALTPIITMIVFTGSYMGMSQLAQDIGGEDKVDRNTGEEAPGLAKQEQMFGAHAAGTAAGGMIDYSSAAAMESLNLGNTLSAMSSATVSTMGQNSATYGTNVGQAASLAAQVSDSSGQTVLASTMNSTSGRELMDTKVGQAFKGGVKSGTSTDAVEVAALTYQAAAGEMMQALASNKTMSWGEKIREAAKAGEKAVDDLAKSVGAGTVFGSGLAAVASGLKGELGTKVQNSLQDTQHWDHMRDAAQHTALSLEHAAQNSFQRSGDQRHQDALTQAINKSKSAQEANSDAVNTMGSEQQAASRNESMGGASTLTSPQLLASLEALRERDPQALGGQSVHNYLRNLGVQAFGGDAAAFEDKVAKFLPVEGNYDAAAARALLTSMGGGYGTAVRMQDRANVINKVMGTLEGSGTSVEKDAEGIQKKATSRLDTEREKVALGKGGLVPAAAAAQNAGRVAQASFNEGKAFQRPTPAADVNPNATPEDYGGQGAQNAAYEQGVGQVLVAGGAGTTTDNAGQIAQKIHQGVENRWLLGGAEAMNKHPGLALGALVATNFANGFADALAKRAMAQKLANDLRKEKPGSPPDDDPAAKGGPPDQTPGGGSSDPASGSARGAADPDGAPPAGKVTTANEPRALTPDELTATQRQLQARNSARAATGEPVASPVPGANEATIAAAPAKQAEAAQAARAATGEPVTSPLPGANEATIAGAPARQAAARQAVKFESEAAAKDALNASLKQAGAEIVAKSSEAQAVATVAAETGTPVGELVAMTIEGSVVVMNANDAATVIETAGGIISQYGLADGTKIMAQTIGDGLSAAADSANAGAAAARTGVSRDLGMPPP